MLNGDSRFVMNINDSIEKNKSLTDLMLDVRHTKSISPWSIDLICRLIMSQIEPHV